MRVVMVAKQKGGAGATTLARELGVAAAEAGKRVVFVDLDPQGTLRGWWNRRTEGQTGDPNPALAAPAPSQIADAIDQPGQFSSSFSGSRGKRYPNNKPPAVRARSEASDVSRNHKKGTD